MKMKFNLHPLHLDKTLLMLILLLVFLDQMIKGIIFHHFFTTNIELIGSFFQFYPVINIYLSWPGNFISLFQNFHFLIILNLLILLFNKYLYCYYEEKAAYCNSIVRISYITFQAGALASLIDKIFWGGSLDYVMVNMLFIFDLKDCYLVGSVITIVLLMLINYKTLKTISRLEFFRFVFFYKDKEIS